MAGYGEGSTASVAVEINVEKIKAKNKTEIKWLDVTTNAR